MRPKFEVGEEVILQSISAPELNGDTVVLDVRYCVYRNWSTKELEEGYLYQLGIKGHNDGWMESSLRKKHKPSDMSFTDLMTSIKSNATA